MNARVVAAEGADNKWCTEPFRMGYAPYAVSLTGQRSGARLAGMLGSCWKACLLLPVLLCPEGLLCLRPPQPLLLCHPLVIHPHQHTLPSPPWRRIPLQGAGSGDLSATYANKQGISLKFDSQGSFKVHTTFSCWCRCLPGI